MKKLLTTIFISLLFASVAAGQALRINILDSPRVTLLPVDIFCILFLIGVVAYLLIEKRLIRSLKIIWSNSVWRLLVFFMVWAVISLVLNAHNYQLPQVLIAFSYWVRLLLVFLVAMVFYVFSSKYKIWHNVTSNLFLIFSGVIILFGYLQLIFLPDFSFMASLGWDPHQGRMLSTFFDPNYLGAFIVLVSSMLLGVISKTPNKKLKIILIGFFIVSWFALYFTYSRSAWAQGAIAFPIVMWRKDWKIALGILAIFIIMVFVPTRLGNRIAQSGSIVQPQNTSVQTNNNYDPSAAARGKSLIKGWNLAKHNWLIGVGYNAYDSALIRSGASGENVNSSLAGRGSDSSLLNIFATTGIIGLILFLSFLFALGLSLYRQNNYVSFSLFGFMIAWILGSFLNNSILYVLILLPFLVLAAISISSNNMNVSDK